MAVQVLTDSTSYIKEDVRKELGIDIVSLNISFIDESMKEIDTDNETFYKTMALKGIPTSSQPSIGDMYNTMLKVVETGDSLCCIFLSSDMSSTLSTGEMAKEMILKEYPEAKIEIVDSRSNSMQLGFAAILAARAAQAGKILDEVKEAALSNIKRSRFLFIPDTLEYLKKGGRIGGANALLGTLLKIKPILTVENGKTAVITKVRTKKNAIMTMIEKMMKDFEEHGLGEIVVHHINCFDEAVEVANLIKEKLKVKIDIAPIGPVVGLHVGPGAIGIVYYTASDMR